MGGILSDTLAASKNAVDLFTQLEQEFRLGGEQKRRDLFLAVVAELGAERAMRKAMGR